MIADSNPMFLTIRQTARLGIVSEYYLRRLEKSGKLPCIYSGNRILVNVKALITQLEEVSKHGQ